MTITKEHLAGAALVAFGLAAAGLLTLIVVKLPFLLLVLVVFALLAVPRVQRAIGWVIGFVVAAAVVLLLLGPAAIALASLPPLFWLIVVAVAIGTALGQGDRP